MEARRNELLRPPVVNVDQVLIVQSIIEPAINPLFFDKLLCVLEKRNIPILIAFSKSDRLSVAMCREWRTRYEKAGYPVHFISSQSGEGIAALESALHDRMTVLAGPSGAGKSTLIRTLTGHCDVLIGALSQKTVRGKQTTRNARIYLLEQGGYLVDTAGFTSLDLRDFTKAEELAACFPEMASLHGNCKFRDCTHRKEPGCAVVQAVAEGRIDQKRYENYLALFQEIEKMNRY